MEQIFQTFLASTAKTDFSLSVVIFNIVFAFVLSLVIAYLYKYTHKGVSYSQSFVLSIVYITVISSVAMMIIGNSIVSAFALLGAFSIIRFRTPVKDIKDISFIFFSLVIGMGVGTLNHQIALVSVIIISIIVLILNKLNFGSLRKYNYILSFHLNTNKGSDNDFKNLFDQYLKNQSLLHINAKKDGFTLEFTFSVNFKTIDDVEAFVSELENVDGITGVSILSSKNDVEY